MILIHKPPPQANLLLTLVIYVEGQWIVDCNILAAFGLELRPQLSIVLPLEKKRWRARVSLLRYYFLV